MNRIKIRLEKLAEQYTDEVVTTTETTEVIETTEAAEATEVIDTCKECEDKGTVEANVQNMTKDEIWNEFESIFEDEKIDFNYIFNFLNSNQLQELLEFVKEELDY